MIESIEEIIWYYKYSPHYRTVEIDQHPFVGVKVEGMYMLQSETKKQSKFQMLIFSVLSIHCKAHCRCFYPAVLSDAVKLQCCHFCAFEGYGVVQRFVGNRSTLETGHYRLKS